MISEVTWCHVIGVEPDGSGTLTLPLTPIADHLRGPRDLPLAMGVEPPKGVLGDDYIQEQQPR